MQMKKAGKSIRYTTISILKETKAELDELLYSSGKKQSYASFIKELVATKKEAK